MKFSSTIKSSVPAVVLGFMALGLASTSAVAATASTTFAVTANVVATCAVSATGMGFGTYAGAALTSSSTLTVTCTNTTPYNVGLNPGATTGATVTTRQMKGTGTNLLNYSLFSNSGMTINWGNTTGSWVAGTGNGNAQSLTVYGQVPANQLLAIDNYADTITATVNY
jgi:spore coat protein U-like protein